jgi:hypothetical protein
MTGGDRSERPHTRKRCVFAIVAINGWNRLAVGLRAPVGDYVSPFGQQAEHAPD